MTNTGYEGNGIVNISNVCDKSNNSHTWKIKHNMNLSSTQSAPINIESSAVFENESGILGKNVYIIILIHTEMMFIVSKIVQLKIFSMIHLLQMNYLNIYNSLFNNLFNSLFLE